MANEKNDKPGSIFSFAPSEDHEERRDDTFTIPSFLRRHVKGAKTEAKPQTEPTWKDDDFARIAATAEEPQAAKPVVEEPTNETTPEPESAPAAIEDVPPVAVAAPVPDQTPDNPEQTIAAQPESTPPLAAPLLSGTPFKDIRPILRDASEKYVSENEAAHRLLSAPFPPATPDILLRPKSEIRVDAKEQPAEFERVEPRLSSIAHVEDADVSQRWHLGPAVPAEDGLYDGADLKASDWNDEEPAQRRSIVRWALLAFVVAAGGYALAHKLDRSGDMAALWPTSPRDELAALSPASPSTLPPAATVAPSPAPAAATAVPAQPTTTATATTIVPDTKPAAIPVIKAEPPAKVEPEAIAPRSVQARAEPSAPVTLAPGPRTLSASSAVRSDVTAAGELVLDIQQRLTALGYSNVPLGGQLDTPTRSAIMAFQRNSGLPMTGSIDSELLNRLRETSPASMRLVKGPDAITPR